MKVKGIAVVVIALLVAACPVLAQIADGQASVGIYGSAKKLIGDNKDDDIISPLFGLKLGYTIDPSFTLMMNGAYGMTYPYNSSKSGALKYITKLPGTPFKTSLIPVTLNFKGNFGPDSKLNPYLTGGVGILFWNLKSNGVSISGDQTNTLGDIGAGIEWFLTEKWGLDLSLHYQGLLNGGDKDMSGYGDKQTGMLEARLGLDMYLGGKKDSDGDGILDRVDKCPKQAEDMDGFEDQDGCPDLDNDGDGIPDLKDKAPNMAEDMDGFQDDDGVPDLDNDGDGIPDLKDKCPNVAEDMDGFEDQDGCPDLDNDGDGIPDLKDKCPNQPETVNGYQDDDGCPDKKPEVVIEKNAPIVLEGVTFETGSATLTAGAKEVLDKVQRTLVDYPEMILEVRGYTDNQGSRAKNVILSQRRADAVRTYLASQGISTTRIQTKGFGPDNPVAPNTTPEGRQQNRRIEFMRLD